MGTKQIDLRVAGLDCESEAAAIERGLRGSPGLLALKVYTKSAKVALNYDPDRASPGALKEKL
jgi:copper chaperone CopZ